MRKAIVLLSIFLLFAARVGAELYIYEPPDKLITFDEVIMSRGKGENLDILKVNAEALKFNRDGSFS